MSTLSCVATTSGQLLGSGLRMASAEFTELLDKLVRQFGTQEKLAVELEMSSGALGRARRRGTFRLDNLLLLADIAGVPPIKLARMAGKQEDAERLERLFKSDGNPLSAKDRRLLALDDEKKNHVIALAAESPPSGQRPGKRKRTASA